jgi:hypothetical protein
MRSCTSHRDHAHDSDHSSYVLASKLGNQRFIHACMCKGTACRIIQPSSDAHAGTAHISAIILVCVRIALLRSRRSGPKFRLTGTGRGLKWAALVASVGALLVVLFQLNARIASDPSPLITGKVAPFEWAGVDLSLSQTVCVCVSVCVCVCVSLTLSLSL